MLNQNFIIPFFITLMPLILYKMSHPEDYDKKKSIFMSVGMGIISILLSYLYLINTKDGCEVLIMTSTILISSIYNYFLLRGNIDLKKLPKTALVVFLFFFASLFQLIPILLFHITDQVETTTIDSWLSLFSDACLLLSLIFIYWDDLKKDLRPFIKNFNEMIDTSMKYWSIGLIVMMVSNVLINLLSPKSVAGNEAIVQNLLDQAPLLTFLTAGIIAPFVEELIFRKSFCDIFKTRWLFILSSGLIFGGLHVVFTISSIWDLLYIIPYSSLGIAFAYTLDKTNNVYASISMHLIHNVILTGSSILMGMVMLP